MQCKQHKSQIVNFIKVEILLVLYFFHRALKSVKMIYIFARLLFSTSQLRTEAIEGFQVGYGVIFLQP